VQVESSLDGIGGGPRSARRSVADVSPDVIRTLRDSAKAP